MIHKILRMKLKTEDKLCKEFLISLSSILPIDNHILNNCNSQRGENILKRRKTIFHITFIYNLLFLVEIYQKLENRIFVQSNHRCNKKPNQVFDWIFFEGDNV